MKLNAVSVKLQKTAKLTSPIYTPNVKLESMEKKESTYVPVKEIPSLDEILDEIGFGKFHVFVIIFIGLIESSDGAEVVMLAFLGLLLKCEWNITSVEQSLLTMFVFVGMLFGGVIFGYLADRFGRKMLLTISYCGLIYFGLLFAAIPTFGWGVVIRLVTGIILAGSMTTATTLTSELAPMRYRGLILLVMTSFWSFGSYFVTTMGLLTINKYGWRVFMTVTVVPMIALVPGFWFILVESPKFLLLKQQKQTALDVLNRIAKLNGAEPIEDVVIPSQAPSNSFWDMTHPRYLHTQCLLLGIWFICGFTYYGVIQLTTMINSVPHRCLQNLSTSSVVESSLGRDDSCCRPVTFNSFFNMYISTTGELGFLVINLVFVQLLSRKATLCILTSGFALCCLLLNLCVSVTVTAFFLALLRGSSNFMFNFIIIYTAEVFPTSVRGLAMGICNGSSRLGGMLSPFLVNVLIVETSLLYGTLFLMSLAILMIVLVIFLPYETRNRKLYQTAEED